MGIEYTHRQEFRVTNSMKKLFIDLGEKNTSEYIRNLVEKDLLTRQNPEFIKEQIKQKKEEIRQLEEILKSPPVMMDEINRFFKQQAPSYKKNAQHRSIEQKHRFIKDVIQPKLKKLGFTKSVEEIDQLLISFPEDNGGG